MKHYYKDHCNDASLTVKNQTIEKDEFLNDDGKSTVMTMRRHCCRRSCCCYILKLYASPPRKKFENVQHISYSAGRPSKISCEAEQS